MKKGVLLFLFLILFSSLAFAGELKVTNEHPFYVGNSWIPAKQLVVGDFLTTIEGKARIIKVEKIENSSIVYNIRVNRYKNYFAGRVLVHNKPVELIPPGTTPPLERPVISYLSYEVTRAGLVELGFIPLSPELVHLWYSGISSLEQLVVRYPGKVFKSSQGSIKDVFLINTPEVGIANLPEFLRAIVPADRPVAIKYLKPGFRVPVFSHARIDVEALAAEKVNRAAREILGYEFYPKNFKYGISGYDSNSRATLNCPDLKGVMAQEMLLEDSVLSVSEIIKLQAELPVVGPRATDLYSKIIRDTPALIEKIKKAYKDSGVYWNDGHNGNVLIGFKNRGSPVKAQRIIQDGEINIEGLEIYYRAIDSGGANIGEPGTGWFNPRFFYEFQNSVMGASE